MKPLSAWALQTATELPQLKSIERLESKVLSLEFYLTSDSLWIVYYWPNRSKIAFRVVFGQTGKLSVKRINQIENGLSIQLKSSTGKYWTYITFPDQTYPMFRYKTDFVPDINLLLTYWPKDILCFTKNWKISASAKMHASQIGNRSGALYVSLNKPKTGSIFYFSNLTALNPYFEQTETSGSELVGGNWPEIGFSLPLPDNKSLCAGANYTLCDSFVLLSQEIPKNPIEVSSRYIEYLAKIYKYLPKPDTSAHAWLKIAEKGLKDMQFHSGYWSYGGGHHYLNAYVSDYKTPPEIMVQLAVLLPLVEYIKWKGEKRHPIIEKLKEGLWAFYDEDLKTIVRWLPALESNLDYSEEQKKPRVMDSWYLHHPLMNLARLAAKGDKEARELLLRSINYCMNVAKKFKYKWPVFYEMSTLKIIKAETAEGEGGEKDVPGTYADLMFKTWELTHKSHFLAEAKRSVKKLDGMGFDLFYQANNTTFSAVALLKLYKLTKQQHYLELSYVCLAGIFKNVQLWKCGYGNGRHFPSFFAVYPLKNAPYTAAYEEQEVYAGLYCYYEEAKGINMISGLKLLIAEFIRYAISRIPYYFPTLLPQDMLATTAKTGEVDPSLWVAIEDSRDGWEQAGQVGQEVYGAGISFSIIPRQYFKISNEEFLIFTDYPLDRFSRKKQMLYLSVGGEDEMPCKLQILLTGKKSYQFKLSCIKDKTAKLLTPNSTTNGHLSFNIHAKQKLKLQW
ncbi:hypothetical protein [Pedobacter sp.]|uniref:hypothetical protein n=1 Tax=Pedobacter sp. TaxID=1411316 RepID=UPI00396C8ADE